MAMPRHSRVVRLSCVLLVLAALALVVAGCGRQQAPPRPGRTATATATATPSLTATPMARALWGWGDNERGQLGTTTAAACEPEHPRPCSLTPVQASLPIASLRAIAVAAGYQYSLLLTADGAVYGWGENSSGQLGNGTRADRATAARVHLPSTVHVTTLVAGGEHALALTSAGQVYAWGENSYGELGAPTGAECPGIAACSTTPVLVRLPAGLPATAIAAGLEHSSALLADGTLYAWGANYAGQLGNGSTDDTLTPTRVHLPAGVHVQAIAAENQASLALTTNGSVYFWGGQWDSGTMTTTTTASPVQVTFPAGVKVTAIAAGRDHQLALDARGRLYAWGSNLWGELGNGTASPSASATSTPALVHLPIGVTVTAIAAGSQSLALATNGTLYAWGYNAYGQLGIGSTTPSATPTPVKLPAGTNVVAFTAGAWHSLALTSG